LSLSAIELPASIVTFSNESTFAAAAASLSTIEFDGIAASGTYSTFPSYTSSGVTFDGVTVSGPGVYIISASYYFEYNRDGHDSIDSFQRGAPAFFNITLPPGTTAAGFDLFSVTEGLSSSSDTETISVNGQDFVVSTLPYNGARNGTDLVFFGFVSSTPVSSFTITTGNLHGNTGVDLEHFQFGSAVAPVPEAAADSCVAGGLLVLALLLARRKRSSTLPAGRAT
jgi:hypothetical protein